MAASFNKFSRSAPVKPAVCFAIIGMFTSFPRGLFLECNVKISCLSDASGRSINICRSNRPGRNNAGSRISGRLVAAIMITPELAAKPSISTRIWFKVCSRSSWPPPSPAPRCLPTASISSIKMMAGANFLA